MPKPIEKRRVGNRTVSTLVQLSVLHYVAAGRTKLSELIIATGLTRRTVRTALQALEDAGAIAGRAWK
jgi:DNA-binding IclR family transcriptional regulator